MEVKEIKNKTRYIQPETERMLWAVSAGICEFRGCCNKLYTHHVTKENVNIAEKAHIYAFSEGGKRFSRLLTRDKINDIANLMLVCKSCHELIDSQNTDYSAEELLRMKAEHEQRIERLVSLKPDLQSEVIIYNANIANRGITISNFSAMEAITPDHYPARTEPLNLSPSLHLYDNEEKYWDVFESDLDRAFLAIEPSVRSNHISLFAIAPQPLLFKLGYLFNRNYNVDVRQPQGSLERWHWNEESETIEPEHWIISGKGEAERIAITIELTARLSEEELRQVFGNSDIHRITIPSCNPHCIKNHRDLNAVMEIYRSVLNEIRLRCGANVRVLLLPIAPVSVSIEAGRQLMKGDPCVTVYDRNYITKEWTPTITLNGTERE